MLLETDGQNLSHGGGWRGLQPESAPGCLLRGAGVRNRNGGIGREGSEPFDPETAPAGGAIHSLREQAPSQAAGIPH